MEPVKRMAADGTWDRLHEEIISLIAIKVAETSEDRLEDLRSLWLCNKATKRVTLSRAIANRFNLEHHYQSKVWGGADALNSYLQTSTGCKVRTMEEPSSSRGWLTYARVDLMVWHSSHEQKGKET
jgi:hypothetical protein